MCGIVLYCNVLYYIELYCNVLHWIVLYCRWLKVSRLLACMWTYLHTYCTFPCTPMIKSTHTHTQSHTRTHTLWQYSPVDWETDTWRLPPPLSPMSHWSLFNYVECYRATWQHGVTKNHKGQNHKGHMSSTQNMHIYLLRIHKLWERERKRKREMAGNNRSTEDNNYVPSSVQCGVSVSMTLGIWVHDLTVYHSYS